MEPPTALDVLSTPQPSQQQERAAVLSKLLDAYDRSVTLNAVLIRGVKHTRRSFLHHITQPILAADTLAEVIEQTQLAVDRLSRLGIVTEMGGELDAARGPRAKPNSLDVLLTIKERNRLTLKTGTEVGDAEGSVSGSATFRNAFGGAECFEASASYGTRTFGAFQGSFSTPIKADPDRMLSVHVRQLLRNKDYSSHQEMDRGTALRYDTVSRLGRHNIYLDTSWRHNRHLSDMASITVREDAGHSLKTSIGHILLHDRRNNPEAPTDGYLLRMHNELAGPLGAGDVQFGKCEVEGQWLQSLGRGFHLSMTMRSGLMLPLGGQNCTTRINDRFLLGGPVSLRGFKLHGVGPRDQNDAIGGDIYCALGWSIFTPLPKVTSPRLKGHLFVNGGSLRQRQGQSLQQVCRDMWHTPSVSAGFGLVYWHSIARFELNFAVPLLATRSDRLSPGIEIGFGLNFL